MVKMVNNQSSIPAPVVADDSKSFFDDQQKKRDMADCFGFKDDDEDDAILSMPAASL